MDVRARNLWEELRSSYWFVPTLMTAAAVALSFVTLTVDERVQQRWVEAVGFIWAGSPEGARELLAAISSSTITVAGVVFSITIVALTLASSQFGPCRPELHRSFRGRAEAARDGVPATAPPP
jgi:uncharacterized membrane protein